MLYFFDYFYLTSIYGDMIILYIIYIFFQLFIPLYVLAAVGGLLLLTGFLGCCGACTENICLLSIFFAIVLILFIAELACGIAILVAKDKVEFKFNFMFYVTRVLVQR